MELFLPSLLAILVAALFAFAIVPQFGPLSLAFVSLLALVAAGVHHYSMFANEYKLSTWQDAIRGYASYIVLGVAILLCIFYLIQMFVYGTYKPATANSANSITNVATAAAAGAAASIGAAVSAIAGPPEVGAAPGQEKTIFEKATNMAAKSLQAMPNVKEAAAQITNPIVAAVNRGLNAVVGPSSNTNSKPPPAPSSALPFSPSEV